MDLCYQIDLINLLYSVEQLKNRMLIVVNQSLFNSHRKIGRVLLSALAAFSLASCSSGDDNLDKEIDGILDRQMEEMLDDAFCSDPAFADSVGCND